MLLWPLQLEEFRHRLDLQGDLTFSTFSSHIWLALKFQNIAYQYSRRRAPGLPASTEVVQASTALAGQGGNGDGAARFKKDETVIIRRSEHHPWTYAKIVRVDLGERTYTVRVEEQRVIVLAFDDASTPIMGIQLSPVEITYQTLQAR